jgi:undecaprenyl diphosphate synthase
MDYSNLKIPTHVAIIMDGNRRWAREKGLNPSKGHLEGSKTLKEIALYASEIGLKVLSVFAFSTENFKRSKEEVDYLMNLFVKMFDTEFKTFKDKNIKVVFSGSLDNLPNKVIKVMNKISDATKDNTGGLLNICLNYGGQDEILDTIKKIGNDIENNIIKVEDIDKELVSKYLYHDLPPIDLLIRTSGEYRVSNFMLWQLAYAEMYFPSVYFPDFDIKQFDKAILEYNNRNRRFGGS